MPSVSLGQPSSLADGVASTLQLLNRVMWRFFPEPFLPIQYPIKGGTACCHSAELNALYHSCGPLLKPGEELPFSQELGL